MSLESEFVRWLTERVVQRDHVLRGIGDDAAIVAGDQRNQVITTDLLCDGVHFRWGEVSAARIGRKALAVNLSDIAAMAAIPEAAVISVAFPRGFALAEAQQLYEGILELADQFDVAVIGGDTNSWSAPLVISVTMWGRVTEHGPLRRDTAQVGDRILVTGPLGGSILSHHLDFTPRVRESLLLRSRYDLHAGMDLTDGLSLDLSRLVASSQVGAELQLDAVPISNDARLLSQSSHKSPLEHALTDGEDFELLLTAAPDVAARIMSDKDLLLSCHDVGKIIAEPGLWSITPGGQRTRLQPQGYEHR
ncbi:MAG: thiamine-monophosphate kinase [Planctomycetales bacterium]|nr:thiamine-monophosphate kinase [Planctomycetales bacterium]MCA9167562.1 thiamine-monophosphate kinase [Planctomycetales bacterium]